MKFQMKPELFDIRDSCRAGSIVAGMVFFSGANVKGRSLFLPFVL
jgi:hypothetical protein